MTLNTLRPALIFGVVLGLILSPVTLLADDDQDDDLQLELVPITQPDPEEPAATQVDAPGEPAGQEAPAALEAGKEEAAATRAEPPPAESRRTTALQGPSTFEDYQARVRFTAEPGLRPPSADHARVGLFGVDLDVRPGDDWWHVGAGGFGAATGNLGGFFGGGLHGGVRIGLLGRVAVEAGAMVGAGGGSGADTGTGFFLRPRAGLHLDLKGFGGHVEGMSVNVSQLYFPTGDFMSTHLALSFELAAPTPLSQGMGARPVPTLSGGGYGASTRAFRFTGHSYFLLPESSLSQSGDALSSPRMMVGLEYREFFTRHGYGLVEPRALVAGGPAGFAELTVGAGFSVPIDREERFSFFGSGGVGAAGGGGVRTGGGIYLRGALGIDIDLPGPLHLGIDAGIQDAPRRGSFTAFSTGLRLGITQEVVRPRAYAVRALSDRDEIIAAGWRLRPTHSTFFGVPESGEDRVVQLGGLKIDHMLGDYAFVTLQGAAAYLGLNRAALSMGTIGVAGRSPEWNRMRLVGEARLGALGGGGVGAGSGFVVQPMAGVHVAITKSIGVDLLGGVTMAPTGELRSPSVDLSLSYAFSTPRLRGN